MRSWDAAPKTSTGPPSGSIVRRQHADAAPVRACTQSWRGFVIFGQIFHCVFSTIPTRFSGCDDYGKAIANSYGP